MNHLLPFYLALYAAVMAFANLSLKWASLNQGLWYWIWFIIANLCGLLGVVVLPLALKLAPANLVYATAIGGGFCLLQITAFWIFKDPLNSVQWLGVALVCMGIVLLNWKPVI